MGFYWIEAIVISKDCNDYRVEKLTTYEAQNNLYDCVKVLKTWSEDYGILYASVYEIKTPTEYKISEKLSFLTIGIDISKESARKDLFRSNAEQIRILLEKYKEEK